ncbi:MAG: 50S ribosomal protein L32 [Clostridia bacterium]|nr:50S ribosomal protein L32 [Clostridia bacterium]MBR7099971.1 50S ribosomal protein L32 [Clostridia bacterium]
MAVPKRKQSKQRTNTRFANFKATAPTLVECPHCHEMKLPHAVCASCGYYDGKQVVNHDEKKN